jgi:hypothetical protein
VDYIVYIVDLYSAFVATPFHLRLRLINPLFRFFCVIFLGKRHIERVLIGGTGPEVLHA